MFSHLNLYYIEQYIIYMNTNKKLDSVKLKEHYYVGHTEMSGDLSFSIYKKLTLASQF